MPRENDFKVLFKEMIKQIQRKVSLKAVILFGSRARGDAHYFSDYDLLIIADFKKPYLERGLWVIHLAPEVSVDVFCYTPAEFDRLFHSYKITTIDAVSEGIVLFGNSFIEPYKLKIDGFIQRGMRREKHVLIPPI